MSPTAIARRRGDLRSEAQLKEHYAIERELANRLRESPREVRGDLYRQVYDELFRRVPHHPQLQQRKEADQLAERRQSVALDLRFLARFLKRDAVYMEIGAGDCALAIAVADRVNWSHAIEVSEAVTRCLARPSNFELHITDGLHIPLRTNSVHVAFSDQLIEHLHPDDAKLQVGEVARTLVPGGAFICITPNRLYGPRDISEYFDERATGLHLREYSAGELRKLLLAGGFGRVEFFAGARGLYVKMPYWLLSLVEGTLDALPHRLRKFLADNAPLRALLGLRLAAFKGEK